MASATRAPDPLARAFGERVRDLREDRGVSRDKLAAFAGISRRMLEFVEHGQKAPGLGTIVALAGALGVEPGQLVDGLRPPPGSRDD